MPKNLGLYDDELSTPRKKDVDTCYGPNNAPPYPVTSVNGQTGAVTVKQNIITKRSVTLSTNWTGSASPYTQSVNITGTTANSKVDLQPDASVIAQMGNDGTTALYIVNNNGTLTAYAVGMKPTASMTVQATVMEVSA